MSLEVRATPISFSPDNSSADKEQGRERGPMLDILLNPDPVQKAWDYYDKVQTKDAGDN